jgi:hypothetical protein
MAGITTGPGWEWPIARLLEIGDGDSVKLAIDHGFGEDAKEWIRLETVRAPEKDEPADWAAAKADVAAWFREFAPDGLVKVTTYRTSAPLEIRFRQSFTRYIGRVTALRTPVELNAWLRAKGWIDRGE